MVPVFHRPNPPRIEDDVRAVIEDGDIRYLGEKQYHGDPVRPGEEILVWTIFGVEMMRGLEEIGYEEVPPIVAAELARVARLRSLSASAIGSRQNQHGADSQIAAHALADRAADNLPRAQIEHHRQLQPVLVRADARDVDYLNYVGFDDIESPL